MKFFETPLCGAYTIELEPYRDDRGFFTRAYCKNEFEAIPDCKEFVQFNHSFTIRKWSLRGLHYQMPPRAENKLIRCIRGKVLDVIVDIRNGSPTFLHHFAVELSAVNMKMIYVPEGFAHGFQTMEDHTELLYFHSAFYSAEHEGGIRYSDPRLRIDWPMPPSEISGKDMNHQLLTESFKGITL
ncbi:MAG: dTDP-4-dehydrorhamnose 3,5-epimerase [Bacteroidota bacterium]